MISVISGIRKKNQNFQYDYLGENQENKPLTNDSYLVDRMVLRLEVQYFYSYHPCY